MNPIELEFLSRVACLKSRRPRYSKLLSDAIGARSTPAAVANDLRNQSGIGRPLAVEAKLPVISPFGVVPVAGQSRRWLRIAPGVVLNASGAMSVDKQLKSIKV
jgi:hypothetical protein